MEEETWHLSFKNQAELPFVLLFSIPISALKTLLEIKCFPEAT